MRRLELRNFVRIAAAVGLVSVLSIYFIASSVHAAGAAPDVAACIDALNGTAGEYGTDMTVFRAEGATPSEIATWQEQRLAGDGIIGIRSRLRDFPDADHLTVCLYLGSFVTPSQPGEPTRDILRVFVLDPKTVIFDAAGYRGRMKPEMPSDQVGSGG